MNSRQTIRWVAGILVILLFMAVFVGVLVLHNHRVQQYILGKVIESEERSTGARIKVHSFTLKPASLTLDLFGVTIHGTESATAPPLLAAGHVRVGIKIVSLIHGKWNLNDVEIGRPVMRLTVNQKGESNIPKPKTQSSTSANLFDLAIQHFLLDDGEIYYNDRKNVLDAELHDLQLQSTFENLGERYLGAIAYQDGLVRFGTGKPVPHSLQARFDASRSRFHVSRLVLTSGSSQLVAEASLEDYSSPRIRATYDANVAMGEFRQVAKNSSIPTGTVRLTGSLEYHSVTNRSFLESAVLRGRLSSPGLALRTTHFRGDLKDLVAAYALENGDFDVRDIRARLLGGDVNGNLTVRDVAVAQQAHFRASLRRLSLGALRASSASLWSAPANVVANLDGDTDITWKGGFQDLIARANAAIQGQIRSATPSSQTALPAPLMGALHATYRAHGSMLTLSRSFVRTPQTFLSLNGLLGDQSALQVRLVTNDLHEIELITTDFRTTSTNLDLSGSGSFTGTVTGSSRNPHLAGLLLAHNLRLKGSSWRLLRTNVSLNPSAAALHNGELQSATQGRISFHVQTGLNHWAYTKSNPIVVNASAAQIRVADLELIAGKQYPVSGLLGARISVHGSQLQPIGQGTIDLTQARIFGEPVQAATVRFEGTGAAVKATLLLRVPAGSAQANLTYYPKTEAYQGQLQAHDIQFKKLRSLESYNLNLHGVFNLSASGRGTIKNPELQAALEIPQLQVRGQTFRGLKLQSSLHNQIASFTLDSRVVNTDIRARGTLDITDGYLIEARLDTRALRLDPLLAAYAPAVGANMGGETEVHAFVHGPLKDTSRLQAHLNIANLVLNYKTIELVAAKPIDLEYRNGVLTVQQTQIRGTGTDLQLQASIPVKSSAPASLIALGTLDLRIAQILWPDIDSQGKLLFHIDSRGTPENPKLQGQIRIVNAAFTPPGAPIGLDQANGVLTMRNDRLEITDFKGQVAGGPVRAHGALTFRPSMQFNLAVACTGARVQYPQGVMSSLDTNLALAGTPHAALLSGQVKIDRLSFSADFDLANLTEQLAGEASAPAAQQSFANNLKLDISVQSASLLNLASSKLSVQGDINLHVRGTASEPVILGRTALTGGEIFFLGHRYIIEDGTIDFTNPLSTQPVVNARATTTVEQYRIELNFRGPIDRLRTTYTSDPSLPPADIIHLIAFGSTQAAANANPNSVGTLGAQAVVSAGIGEFTSRVSKIAGISNLSIDPNLGGNQANPGVSGPRIAIQQRVTSNLYVTFATDVTTTQDEVIQLQYKVTPRISVGGIRDQNGGFAFGARIHKTW